MRRDTADGERVRVLGIDLAVNEAISQVGASEWEERNKQIHFLFPLNHSTSTRMSSDSSDDDLPPPSVLLDKLLTPSTPLKPTRSTLSKSINKPVSNPPLPLSESATPYKDTTRQQRRSSPRLLEKRVCQSQTSSSISPPPPPLPLPIQRALSPLVLEDQDLSRESERERHDSLVMELFPPSPPPPQTHSSTSNRQRSQSVVSDSEAESREIGIGIGMRRNEEGKCRCEGEKNLRRTSEGTVVSDSEAENNQSYVT